MLEQWNDTERPVEGGCLHELVAAHAARAPERIAVEGSGTTLSYGELDERANRLAHHLQHLGVGAGDLVGICLDRVPATMVAILATLKTGAAYVPVEPTYPAERQAFMLDDAQAPVLVTQESLLEALPAHNGSVVCIDRDWTEIAARARDGACRRRSTETRSPTSSTRRAPPDGPRAWRSGTRPS